MVCRNRRGSTGQPPDRFYADPFLLDVSGEHVRLLVEEYRYPTRTKQLVEIEITRAGRVVGAHVQRGLPQPASYPFLHWIGADLYCIPEAFGAAQASAFKRRAANEWSLERTLLSGIRAVDSTLLRHEGRWWLFCTKQGDEDQTELHLFAAPEWSGPWTPHPLNPVKSDTRSSRPAGACSTVDGVVYRPAQNCARRYGAGITINRIEELSLHAFREVPVLSLQPASSSPWPDGMHTINSRGGVTVVDGLRVERRWGPATLSTPLVVSDTSHPYARDELGLDELAVQIAGLQQNLMRADGDDTAGVEDHHAVDVHDRG